MNITNAEGNLIVQLLDEREKLLTERKRTGDGKVEFNLLDKGRYKLRVIYDINGDGKWTTGDYDTKLQPEPVSYLDKIIEIKANWDSNETWDVSALHEKSEDPKAKKKR